MRAKIMQLQPRDKVPFESSISNPQQTISVLNDKITRDQQSTMLVKEVKSPPSALRKVQERQLTRIESLFVRHSCNCVAILKLNRPVTTVELQNAVDQVQKAEPMLRTRIATLNSGLVKTQSSQQKIAVEKRFAGKRDADTIVSELLNRCFNLSTGPLAHVVFMPYVAESIVYMAYHHVIADGQSMVFFARQLATYLNKHPLEIYHGSEGNENHSPVQSNIQRVTGGVAGLCRSTRFLVRGAKYIFGPSAGFQPRNAALTSEPKDIVFYSTQFNIALTKRIVSCAKAHETSVHGILMAAFLVALAQTRNSFGITNASLRLLCATAVDLRRLAPSMKQTRGSLASGIATSHALNVNDS
ncbi:MAG TPA: hypothetical protein EYO58_11725, partial [Flavobacteriales bacterium]|nr:hypothetical protein [Flavobacteriales bacterium]